MNQARIDTLKLCIETQSQDLSRLQKLKVRVEEGILFVEHQIQSDKTKLENLLKQGKEQGNV